MHSAHYHLADRHSASIIQNKTVGGLTIYCVDAFTTLPLQAGIDHVDSETTIAVEEIEWPDCRRVDCVLIMHSPHDIVLQAGIVHLHASKNNS